MHSALVNSVMIRPQPPRPRIMRRNTVSVTPAIGARTVPGEIWMSRIEKDAGSISPRVVFRRDFAFAILQHVWPARQRRPAQQAAAPGWFGRQQAARAELLAAAPGGKTGARQAPQ